MTRKTVLAPIKERYTLSATGSSKKTYHIVLDLQGLDVNYQVGDCVAIYPQNQSSHVESVLGSLQATGNEQIDDRRNKQTLDLKAFLSTRADLFRIKKKLLAYGQNPVTDAIDLVTFLEKNAPLKLDLQEFCDLLYPLLPRFYSIASSMKEVGPEAHLTVGLSGLCTEFLCERMNKHEPLIQLYHHPAKNFTLSEASFSKPIIMVGPGTGIAPFVGFLQERIQRGSKNNWLFFGERNRAHDFYYQEYLEGLEKRGWLTLDTAFSRDQEEKIYVQHKMLQNKSELWQWLQEGAYFFVCGDASKMAKAVDQTLHRIIAEQGNLDASATKKYIRDLKLQSRYLRDIY